MNNNIFDEIEEKYSKYDNLQEKEEYQGVRTSIDCPSGPSFTGSAGLDCTLPQI
ncbi:hypothetical protein [Ruminococcus sp.]|uniref:hypothetical protein n=1 Tax=Ruminococcus sp. TaxID=41978 RepID=UPI0025E01E93|nr:hypothetical protein [Ruminococcus sp.]